MKTYRIATIPGDGIGKEVVPAGQQVLQALADARDAFRFEFQHFGWGGDWYRQHGEMMPADGLAQLRGHDAILFGSAGDPHIADHITLWGLRLKICQGFDQYANVRPTRILSGIDAPLKRCKPEDLNWVIVRENSEGEYSGVGGRVHQGQPIEAATDVSIMTRAGVQRIMRFAFKLAQSRPRKLLTVVTKSNAQRHAMVMWDEIALEVSREFPDVTWDKELVDAATARMVNRPARAWTRSSPPTCTPTSCLTWPPRWPAAWALRPPATSTPSAVTRACSSRSTARPSTSWARAWPTPWARSGAA
jgi:tartrate dehydrogenase/decarboxylase / D-malate dehydrogenase